MTLMPAYIAWILPTALFVPWLLCEIILISFFFVINHNSIERVGVFYAKSISLAFIGNVLYSITSMEISVHYYVPNFDSFRYDDLPTFFLILAIFLFVVLLVYLLIKFVFFRKTSNCAIILSVLLISAPWIAFIPPISC